MGGRGPSQWLRGACSANTWHPLGRVRFGGHAYQPQGHFCTCARQCNNKSQDAAKISSSYGISHVSHGALKEEIVDNGDQRCSLITAARGRKDQKTKGIVNTNPGLTIRHGIHKGRQGRGRWAPVFLQHSWEAGNRSAPGLLVLYRRFERNIRIQIFNS